MSFLFYIWLVSRSLLFTPQHPKSNLWPWILCSKQSSLLQVQDILWKVFLPYLGLNVQKLVFWKMKRSLFCHDFQFGFPPVLGIYLPTTLWHTCIHIPPVASWTWPSIIKVPFYLPLLLIPLYTPHPHPITPLFIFKVHSHLWQDPCTWSFAPILWSFGILVKLSLTALFRIAIPWYLNFNPLILLQIFFSLQWFCCSK